MALKEESLVALRVAHLSMIQGVITRMSGFSASAKTFTITILAGLAAISLQAAAAQLGVIAMMAAIALFLVDTYYMILELRFRTFYDEVATRDLDQATDIRIMPRVKPDDTKKAIKSLSNLLFYGPVLFSCTLFIWYGIIHERNLGRLPQPNTPRVEQPVDANSAAAGNSSGPLTQPTAAAEGHFEPSPGQLISTIRTGGTVRHEPATEGTGQPVRPQAAGTTTR